MLPPPESSKSRHAKQQKPEEVAHTTAAIESSAIETSVKVKNARAIKEDDWLNSSTTTKADIANQIHHIELKTPSNPTAESKTITNDSTYADETSGSQQTPPPQPATAASFMDAFSDLDPLGTGKFRPYIDKKYFFQDLKNPPKKVLKDLTDRDAGFSVSFSAGSNQTLGEFAQFNESSTFDSNQVEQNASNLRRPSDSNDEFGTQFAHDTQIFSPNNNGTHGTPPSLSRPPADVFSTTFHVSSAAPSATSVTNEPIIASSKPAKTDEQNATYAPFLVMNSDPFSPRVTKKFDVFEDDFSKKSMNSFDFSRFNNGEHARFGGDRSKAHDKSLFNGSKRESQSKRHASDSMSENEIAPDPPPRPELHMPNDPPPLPPKKQFSDFHVKRPVSREMLSIFSA